MRRSAFHSSGRARAGMDHAMSEPARNRFALDLEDLERQLRGAAQAPRPGQATDPLAELTRIVGQDDPLKDLFAPRPAAAARRCAACAPAAPVASPSPGRKPAASRLRLRRRRAVAPPAELRGALDEFEALLRRGRRCAIARRPRLPPRSMCRRPSRSMTTSRRPAPMAARSPACRSEAGPRDLDQHRGLRCSEQAYAPDGA